MRFELKPQGMRLRHRRWLWFWFVLVVGIFVVLSFQVPLLRSTEMLIAFLTIVFGAFYFLQQQNFEQARFFKELVNEFNRRYDDKNEALLKALESKEPFDSTQEYVFIDYFNLCAEEYLFYDAGYIDVRVWKAWCNGMKQFGHDQRVIKLWNQESQMESYYGFEFPIDSKMEIYQPARAE